MLCFETHSHDPAYNLALEETVLTALSGPRRSELGQAAADPEGVLLLWRNGPSIIVGRHQNTQAEVNLSLVRERVLPVVRRLTGGGAVYHDLGNLNYTFIRPSAGRGADFAPFMRPIAAALAACGVRAAFNSRNDLTVDGKKVSGSAQMRRKGVLLHHGTVLYDADLETMAAALTPDPEKLRIKGLESLRSRVMNLRDALPASVSLEDLTQAIRAACNAAAAPLPGALAREAGELAESRYRSWEWNWGASPAFSIRKSARFAWGSLTCLFQVERGRITCCAFQGDFFGNGLEPLEHALTGAVWRAADMRKALERVDLESAFHGCAAAEAREFICSLADA